MVLERVIDRGLLLVRDAEERFSAGMERLALGKRARVRDKQGGMGRFREGNSSFLARMERGRGWARSRERRDFREGKTVLVFASESAFRDGTFISSPSPPSSQL